MKILDDDENYHKVNLGTFSHMVNQAVCFLSI